MGALGNFGVRLQSWLDENPEAVAKISLWLQRGSEPGSGGGRSLADQILPSNWVRLQIGLMQQLPPLMEESGLCLVWVPRVEVIEAIFAAPDPPARETALLSHAPEILEDVGSILTEVTHPEIAYLRQFVAEATAAFQAGVKAASQALSAVAIGSILEDHYGFDGFGDARRSFEIEVPQSAGMWSSRRVWVQVALHRAILRSDQMPADAGFNRNVTAHGSDQNQFTSANALAALLLAAGSLRELQEMYRVGEMGFSPSGKGRLGDVAAKVRLRADPRYNDPDLNQ